MEPSGSSQAAAFQRQLSDFLNAELIHTLGAYKIAEERLVSLHEQTGGSIADAVLREAIVCARECNGRLRGAHLHGGGDRHGVLQLDDPPAVDLLQRIAEFYRVAARALILRRGETQRGEPRRKSPGSELGWLLATVRDPHRRGDVTAEHERTLVEGRLQRTLHRLHRVNEALPVARRFQDLDQDESNIEPQNHRFQAILDDYLGVAAMPRALHLTVIDALRTAHELMHYAETLRGQRFREMFTTLPETHARIEEALRLSLVLNTFVYVVGRGAAWVFAESESERDQVCGDGYQDCCDTLAPTYCMWIGTQMNLLALHRRAYTFWTLGQRDSAYRDFFKLTRFLRDLRQRTDGRAVRAPGTKTLIEGLTAISEHHIGRIYRGQHAHRVALRYFNRASLHLKGWEDHEEIGLILRNSRWRLNMLISQGKANYELGRIKSSILAYVRAWRAFLLLVESESHMKANLQIAADLMTWLNAVEKDPHLSKTDLQIRIEPLVQQFETFSAPAHMHRHAADIMMRLGHVLFILKMPRRDWPPPREAGNRDNPPVDHDLARRCLRQAAKFDPSSTLVASDLLKIRHYDPEGESPGVGPTPRPFDQQRPSGGGRFEEAARIIEYLLQKWLADSNAPAGADGADRREIARELLGAFLAHTDSSNVKLAQVYRYLMQKPRSEPRDATVSAPTLDLVCMRRYSSFFPFLPRPTAFRAPGGGYFVQVSEGQPDEAPFGIAIDPGPDFLDGLYRCGYGLADVHMIVVTHDHADHVGSLDAMLSLMGIRLHLGDDTFSRSSKLVIVGNESIRRRYGFFNDPDPVRLDREGKHAARRDAVEVLTFKQVEKATHWRKAHAAGKEVGQQPRPGLHGLLGPETLRIKRVQTYDHTDASGNLAQGFTLSIGSGNDRRSALFTSDTGPAQEASGRTRYRTRGKRSLLQAAANADVVVAHLSSVPLREMRELAGGPELDQQETTAQFQEMWREAVQNAEDPDPRLVEGTAEAKFLLRQLQFGFRSLAPKLGDLSVSPLSATKHIKEQPDKHLYLTGLLDLAEHMAQNAGPERQPLLLIGELREELGTFRTRIADHVTNSVFAAGDVAGPRGIALTADIGLRIRVTARPTPGEGASVEETSVGQAAVSVLCTTCDLDNDLVAEERFHPPWDIREVCVKGENEGVFYNCWLHDPGKQDDRPWIESVERYDVFAMD